MAAGPPDIVTPILIGVVTLAAYETNYAMGDLAVVVVFGILGVFMKLYGWPRPPILMALVLSKIVEKYLWLSINTYGARMLLRPQFLAILAVIGIVIFTSLRLQVAAKGAAAAEAETVPMSEAVRKVEEVAAPLRTGLDSVGEAALLIIVGSFFVYLFVSSLSWTLGAALMPRLTVALGTPFLIARVSTLLRRTGPTQERGKIMDTGFRLGVDPKAEGARFQRICLFILGLYLAIWIFGFHIALPLGVFLYLFFYGKAGWIGSSVFALLFLGLIVGVYDDFLHASWQEPLVFQLLNDLR